MKTRTILLATLLFVLPSLLFAQGLTYDEQMHDFGHIGIDFKVQHTFMFPNRTDQPIKIKNIDVLCDCSKVGSADTLIQPGDTAFFNLTFDSKDYYGPTNKSFIVSTDHPKLPELEYFYLSIIGQWFNGLKPRPISLFFLASNKSKAIEIPNKAFDEISIVSVTHFLNYINSKIVTGKASKGKSVKIEIVPDSELKPGTYHTTVVIAIKADDNENTILSIPIKIVKY